MVKDKWEKIANLKHGRREHASVCVKSYFMAIGGYSSSGVESTCERFKLGSNEWKTLQVGL